MTSEEYAEWALRSVIATLGIQIVGTEQDHRRWSTSDFVTDAIPVLAQIIRAAIRKGVTMPEKYWEAVQDDIPLIRQAVADDVKGDEAKALEACNQALPVGQLEAADDGQPDQRDVAKSVEAKLRAILRAKTIEEVRAATADPSPADIVRETADKTGEPLSSAMKDWEATLAKAKAALKNDEPCPYNFENNTLGPSPTALMDEIETRFEKRVAACGPAPSIQAPRPKTALEKLYDLREYWIDQLSQTHHTPMSRKTAQETFEALGVVRELTVLIRALEKDDVKSLWRGGAAFYLRKLRTPFQRGRPAFGMSKMRAKFRRGRGRMKKFA